MKEKTIWHPATEFPGSGAYVLVVYNGRLREQTVNQKILADFFETSHGDHAMAVGHFHPTWGAALDRRTHIPGVKYPKRTPQTNAAIVDQIGDPIDFSCFLAFTFGSVAFYIPKLFCNGTLTTELGY